ncbi:DUF58 domain-containing protein [Thermococcus indicus]|uniref:DUF58 domain-containing protein n=1 Tax=Thermococcus indicus TaxID=2586643 RepID=A0A4Y5SPQ8_9EURY|nr:DUF58 domain-containing protein [Thermococcus indicus]QDA32112.1 DUF58 domain-containing protein [Thermococcus indicus]
MRKNLTGYLLWALLLGTLFLSPGMIGLATVPLSVLALGTLIEPPKGITVVRRISRREVRLGEEVEVRVRVTVERGMGIVVVRDPLPGSVALTEGSSVGVFFKGPRPLQVEYTYRIKPVLRGVYSLPRSEVTTRNPLGTRYLWGLYGEELRIRAVPRVLREVSVIETRRKARISVPETSYSIRGPISTDFKEIRNYQTGDPMKLINWKATARMGEVLVNEFEREGKKTVLFIVDAREAMKIGKESESPYEHAMNLVASMAHSFLRKDYHVGLYLLGAGKFIPPATGPRQLHEIVRTMMSFERVQTGEERLDDAVERLRRILIQYTPLVVYVSNILEGTWAETRRGMLTVRAMGRGKTRPMVIDISVYPTLDPGTGTLMEMEKRAIMEDLEKTGAYVIRWLPGEEETGRIVTRLLGEIR